MPPSVLVTGSTGLLGRAVVQHFTQRHWTVHAASFSRGEAGTHVKIDLRDQSAVVAMMQSLRPTVVIHCAAERRPDVCEKDAGSEVLNVDSVWFVGKAASQSGASFIHISTDYLFDGKSPPYFPDSPVSPLNAYGRQKVRGEYAAMASHPSAVVLRVPVLFGPTEDLRESAVTAFAEVAREGDKSPTVDDWQIRVPTFTPDIAATLCNIASALTGNPPPGAAGEGLEPSQLKGIFQYSSKDSTTRYRLVQAFGEMLGVGVGHVVKQEGMPPGAIRPYDCMLDTGRLDRAGLSAPCTNMLEAFKVVLKL